MINAKIWYEAFNDFNIFDCAVRNKNVFSFIAIGEKGDNADAFPPVRLINILADKGEMGFSEYTGFNWPNLAIARKPVEQAVMVSSHGYVAVLGAGERHVEAKIPIGTDTTPLFTSAQAVATIDGYLYAVGAWRAVCRRSAKGKWENLADRKTLPEPKENKHGSSSGGFEAIDGFNSNDIYCAGGKGDIWRFDGTCWYHCAVPTNMYIHNLCCAGDGYVYVGMQSGSIMRGRENRWEIIHTGDFTLPFKDIVWFSGKIWCTSDYGLWTIENGKLIDADVPVAAHSCSGNLSVGDGVMLLAGRYGAAVFDGKTWEQLSPEG